MIKQMIIGKILEGCEWWESAKAGGSLFACSILLERNGKISAAEDCSRMAALRIVRFQGRWNGAYTLSRPQKSLPYGTALLWLWGCAWKTRFGSWGDRSNAADDSLMRCSISDSDSQSWCLNRLPRYVNGRSWMDRRRRRMGPSRWNESDACV